MFPTLKIFGVISNPGSPLVRGALTRPLGQQTDRGQTDSELTRPISVKELAKKKGITMAQVALAWILTKDGEWFFTFMYVLDPSNPPPKVSAPIVGATNYKISLVSSDSGIDVKLTMEEIRYLEQEYKPSVVIGH
ncbi:hypothetical protein BDR04DRAFT_1202457, partial [Suillus decipiens]